MFKVNGLGKCIPTFSTLDADLMVERVAFIGSLSVSPLNPKVEISLYLPPNSNRSFLELLSDCCGEPSRSYVGTEPNCWWCENPFFWNGQPIRAGQERCLAFEFTDLASFCRSDYEVMVELNLLSVLVTEFSESFDYLVTPAKEDRDMDWSEFIVAARRRRVAESSN